MKIAERGVVAKSTEGTDRQSCCFAWACVLPTGRWIVTYREGTAKTSTTHRLAVTWSDDGGRTWSPPIAPFRDRTIRGTFGQFRAAACTALGGDRVLACLWWVDCSDTSRPLFNEKTEGILDSLTFTSLSEDGGRTWSDPAQVNTAPYDTVPCAICGPVLLPPDGRWICHFEVERPYDDAAGKVHPLSAMVFSADQGTTWGNVVVPVRHPENRIYYWDQRPSVLRDGTLLDMFWVYDRKEAKYLNTHAARSDDSGTTWSQLWDTGIAGQPGPAQSMSDGRIVLPYVDRTKNPCIKLRVSADGGRTWPEDTEVLVHAPELKSQQKEKKTLQDMWDELQHYSVGLPDARVLPDGDILVTYYTGPHADRTDIEWVRLTAR